MHVTDQSCPQTASLAVVGSTNLDVVVPVERHPRLGETVLGGDHVQLPGGKGANQAVAAARLGAPTTFVGRVGNDDAGRILRSALQDDGVDLAGLGAEEHAPSGLALIVVTPDGENTIVVSPGANGRLSPEHVHDANQTIADADALLVQLEIPPAAVEAAVHIATGLVVCNPAPAATLPPSLLAGVDVLVPNRGELATLVGADHYPADTEAVAELARTLRGPQAVVVTLGPDGALIVTGDETTAVPAHPVDAVDATAAGDAFCAALTVQLAVGASLEDAARYATLAAALATTRRGAQASLPRAADVAALLP